MYRNFYRPLMIAVVLVLSLAFLAACYPPSNLPSGSPSTSPSTPSGGTSTSGGTILPTDVIEGIDWQLVSVGGAPAVPGSQATMTLNGGTVSGTAGCNRYSGSYVLGPGDALKFGQIAMTQMACAAPVMAQEQAFATALGATASAVSTGGTLLLKDASGADLATFKPRESTSLTGTNWIATGINNGKGAVASVVLGTDVTAVFGTDGTLAGKAGCNDYSATYKVDGSKMTITQPVSTRMFCGGEGVMDQETAYLNALTNVATYKVDGDRLELRAADGALQAQYTSKP
jgi:heat shock protein HslJ